MTDLAKFNDILNEIKIFCLIHGKNVDILNELKKLFLKHYSISEDEILKLAQGILIKREKK
jgi:hypothetical protein